MRGETATQAGDLACKTDTQMVVQLGATVRSVVSAMRERNASSAFIVDESGKLRGSISGDTLERSLETQSDSTLDVLGVLSERRTTKVVTVDAPIHEVFRLMNADNVEVLPVVDSNETLYGFIAMSELRAHLSPERIYPSSLEGDDLDENVERHMARYRFASQFIRSGDAVLDGACGAGYGSAILAEKAGSVTGADISDEAIRFALDTYKKDNIRFLCSDLNSLCFEDERFDAVVCLETMEHLPFAQCSAYMKSVQRWIKPGGILFASSPMLRYLDGKPYVTNPHHVNEMPKKELLEFFKNTFPNFSLQFFHQKQNAFLPLLDEHTGFCIIVARKGSWKTGGRFRNE